MKKREPLRILLIGMFTFKVDGNSCSEVREFLVKELEAEVRFTHSALLAMYSGDDVNNNYDLVVIEIPLLGTSTQLILDSLHIANISIPIVVVYQTKGKIEEILPPEGRNLLVCSIDELLHTYAVVEGEVVEEQEPQEQKVEIQKAA
ncbi:MAG: hypothetical protein OXR68_00970 [Alphaproteobacteria bacterium]|nr:hypothetical protein [Alphaproteobacteria bacterium]MDD9919182.1 hypothetical protein [Alphaproteobacteria bacterium]